MEIYDHLDVITVMIFNSDFNSSFKLEINIIYFHDFLEIISSNQESFKKSIGNCVENWFLDTIHCDNHDIQDARGTMMLWMLENNVNCEGNVKNNLEM